MADVNDVFEVYCPWMDNVEARQITADVNRDIDSDALAETFAGALHVETPLVQSLKLSEKNRANVWLKLDNLQPSQSFKLRGLGYLCQKAARKGCSRFFCSSGGNAGLAAAYCARSLRVPITVVVPESTPTFAHGLLRQYGADVLVHGKAWDDADKKTRELCQGDKSALKGHSSMVHEIRRQLAGERPDVLVVALGGGGLLCGVLQGLHEVGWGGVPVVAVETRGADSLAECARQGRWTEIPAITSMAKCLGARRVARRAYEWLAQHHVLSVVVSDKDAVSSCVQFADDHKMMVELACGAPLSMVYGEGIKRLQQADRLPRDLKNIVVVVCGGSMVNIDLISSWKAQVGL